MAKRHSQQESSLSPVSSAGVDDDDAGMNTLQKPSKRLKTADGSAAASPGSAKDHQREDDEMQDEPVIEKDTKNAKPHRRSRVSGMTQRERGRESGPGGGAEDDVEEELDVEAEGGAAEGAEGTVVNHNDEPNEAPEANDVNDANDQHDNLLETMSSISEDTDGDVPLPKKGSYHHLAEEEINNNEPQVTVCAWDGCKTGDLQTMDRLVEHLHSEHVEGKQRRYTCEWIGCPRKGKSHASAYALKAHLRSHTREKPHVCLLPECDQAFARQDALNKHMRTSHEIDLMRSIDPAPRSVQLAGKSGSGGAANSTNGSHSSNTAASQAGANGGAAQGKSGSSKLKIIIKTPQSHAAGQDDSVDYGLSHQQHGFTFVNEAGTDTALTRDQGFTARELEMPLDKLYGLCRCQLRWAEEEGEALRKECADWEEAYHQAWLEQQVLLDQVIKSEKDWHERRKAVLASLAAEEEKRAEEAAAAAKEAEDAAEADGDGIKDDDEDSAGDDDGDNDGDDDDDVTSIALDPDATRDEFSFADNTSLPLSDRPFGTK